MNNKGFTLIELIVALAIVAVLSGVILFSVSQYINKGKDSNVAGNLAVLIPAGEVYYNANNSSYLNFCQNDVFKNAVSQMPKNPAGPCLSDNLAGVCCRDADQAWVACAQEFANSKYVFCVDSRGVKKEIENGNCATIKANLRCP
jgi:prepilin-type N-terminal cleavage/methylation domain-containing protein